MNEQTSPVIQKEEVLIVLPDECGDALWEAVLEQPQNT